MPTLPDTQSFGPRPTPSGRRGIATISDPGAVGRAQEGLGRTIAGIGEAMHERKATAEARDGDTRLSAEIRELMYNPETGFANLKGKAAVDARPKVMEQLSRLRGKSLAGLSSNTAKRKFEPQIQRRIDSVIQSIDIHSAREHDTWATEGRMARIDGAYQDALANPGAIAASIHQIEGDLIGLAKENGWHDDKLGIELEKARSKVYSDQVTRIAATDPSMAMEYLEKNRDSMQGADFIKLKSTLEPAAKAHQGVRAAQAEFASLGDMSAVMGIAADTLGMDENAQNVALQAYLKDGGVNLDPATTAWCAAFINATLSKAGIGGTNSNMARSFLDWGVDAGTPQKGDVVVLERGSDQTKGHVGFFEGYDANGDIILLGGNQGDSVSTTSYSKSRVLGVRRAVAKIDKTDAAEARLRLAQEPDAAKRKAALAFFDTQVGARVDLENAVTEETAIAAAAKVRDAPTKSGEELALEIERAGDIKDPVERALVLDELNLQASTAAGVKAAQEEASAIAAAAEVRNGGGFNTDLQAAQLLARIAQEPDPVIRATKLDEWNLLASTAEGVRTETLNAAIKSANDGIAAGGKTKDIPLDVQQALGATAMNSLRATERSIAAGIPIKTDDQTYVELSEMAATDPRAFIDQNPAEWRDLLDDGDFEFFVKARANMMAGQREPGVPPDISSLRTASKTALQAAGLDKKPKVTQKFESDLLRWSTQFTTEQGKAPSPLEINDRINEMLVPVVIDPKDLWNNQTGQAFTIDFDGSPLDPNDDLKPKDIRDGSLTINGTSVSNDLIELYAAGFEDRFGRAPSVQELVEGLIASGVFE